MLVRKKTSFTTRPAVRPGRLGLTGYWKSRTGRERKNRQGLWIWQRGSLLSLGRAQQHSGTTKTYTSHFGWKSLLCRRRSRKKTRSSSMRTTWKFSLTAGHLLRIRDQRARDHL